MKIAVSNIAWTKEEESEVANLLRSLGVKYVEIAPTKTWDEPLKASRQEIEEYVAWWRQYDIEVVAFQSMLFSHPDYKMFDSSQTSEVKEYLEKFVEVARIAGAKRMVFGSPKNRQRGDLIEKEALEIAIPFFKDIGNKAADASVVFCIEPNAPQYACDFITNAAEGTDLVRKIHNKGIGLHLDTACMYLAGDDLGESIKNASGDLMHFHVSAPMLGAVNKHTDIDHKAAHAALVGIGYEGYVSIEMRPGDQGENVQRVEEAVRFTQSIYDNE